DPDGIRYHPARWAIVACAAAHLCQSLRNERREHPDPAEDPGSCVAGDDDALCPSCARPSQRCGHAWPTIMEKGVSTGGRSLEQRSASYPGLFLPGLARVATFVADLPVVVSGAWLLSATGLGYIHVRVNRSSVGHK